MEKPVQHIPLIQPCHQVMRKHMSRVVRKPAFCIFENKDADQLRGNREADQRLCFRNTIVQSLYFLNPKFQASSHLLWLYSLVCVGPGQKSRRPVFSHRGSYAKSSLSHNAVHTYKYDEQESHLSIFSVRKTNQP